MKAVIFDVDGVLFDTGNVDYMTLNMALNAYGQAPIPWERHRRELDGLSSRQKLERIGINGRDSEAVITLKQGLVLDAIRQRARPDREIQRMLVELRRRGLLVGTYSNADTLRTVLTLARLDILPLLDAVVSRERLLHPVDRPVPAPKPDPAGYLLAMEVLRVGPGETLIVEDAPAGVEAARRSGARVMVVKGRADVTLEAVLGCAGKES